jgi:hypothetical protein
LIQEDTYVAIRSNYHGILWDRKFTQPSYRAGLVLSLSQSCIGTKSKQVLIIQISVTTICILAVYFQILLVHFAGRRSFPGL